MMTKLARAASGGLLSVDAAADALGSTSREASLKLASLARRGWLRRARRGLYLILPLEADPTRESAPEDTWVVAQKAFSPCYIGGWSAAEHWGLTEQIFRSTLVITAANVRAKSVRLLGSEFRLFRVPRSRITAVASIWRGSTQVLVSSRERTIVDCLRSPELCGGVRTLFSMLRECVASPEFDRDGLLSHMMRFGNGAAWKRLGFLIEALPGADARLTDVARQKLTAGNVKLDPSLKGKGHLLRRWGLWINSPITAKAEGT